MYEKLYGPVGPQRTDYHETRLLWFLANMMRGGKDLLPMKDFLPFPEGWQAEATDEPQKHPNVVRFEQMYQQMHGESD